MSLPVVRCSPSGHATVASRPGKERMRLFAVTLRKLAALVHRSRFGVFFVIILITGFWLGLRFGSPSLRRRLAMRSAVPARPAAPDNTLGSSSHGAVNASPKHAPACFGGQSANVDAAAIAPTIATTPANKSYFKFRKAKKSRHEAEQTADDEEQQDSPGRQNTGQEKAAGCRTIVEPTPNLHRSPKAP